MSTIELEARKIELIKSILDIDSEALLTRVETYIGKIKHSKTPPCQFTEKELKARVTQGMIDAKNGLGCSQEEMRNRYPRA